MGGHHLTFSLNLYLLIIRLLVLPAHFPISGVGFLPVIAFVIKAREPVLVATGMGIDSEEFMKALESTIDPQKSIRHHCSFG